MEDDILFFETPSDFRDWLAEHHDKREVQWLGLYKVNSGKPSIRWEESVRAALCFGWIDGLRKSIDEESYKIRFTPRNPDSHWSKKNIEMAEELIDEGKMHPAGLKAFENRDEKNSGRASFEQDHVELKPEYLEQIKRNEKAWQFFEALAPSYTKSSIHWVMSAKKEETRQRRLRILIESSEKEEKIPLLQWGDQ
ncbi:YdeI/OmpD-associated family protein [Aliifodinibius sp. S!AR15-10]|uniref:YdeI/OmpD-associated family protein n=1 Tax=Aliifodinibius sp. S!AR15-10 TaxID=2950437 RepID=UPI00285A6753|nr:YdeI/OmpD-associated family protein [Aliifodinibius sp. S!AR15-10]MDR8393894.1 YdeI/OmpD-associated family protein [Aliifodinibius sp. S!AR15-10]